MFLVICTTQMHGRDDSIIIDVNPSNELAKTARKVSGSIHIPCNKLNYPLKELMTTIQYRSKKSVELQTPIRICCSSCGKEKLYEAVALLTDKGFTNVSVVIDS